VHDGPEEKWIAVGLAVQPGGEIRQLEFRIIQPFEQRRRIARVQPRQRHVPRLRFTAKTIQQSGEAFVVFQFLVPIRTRQEHRPTGNLPGEKMQESQAGVVGPLRVVNHDDQLPVLRQRVKELLQRTKQARLPSLGKVRRQRGQVHQTSSHGRHQRGDFSQQDGGDLAQAGLGGGLAGLRGEINDRLVSDRAFNLVAIGHQHWQIPLARIAGDLAHQPAFADTGLTFDQHHLATTRREPGDQTEKLPVLVAAPDERRFLLARRGKLIAGCLGVTARASGGHDRNWQGIKRQAIRHSRRARGLKKDRSLRRGNGQLLCQSLGQRFRRPTFVCFDLLDGRLRATDFLSQRILGQVQRFAPASQPVAKRIALIKHVGVRPRVVHLMPAMYPRRPCNMPATSPRSADVPFFVPLFVPFGVTRYR